MDLDDELIDALANAKAVTSLDLTEGHCDWQSLRRLLSSFPRLQKLDLYELNGRGSHEFSVFVWTEVFRGAPGLKHLQLGGDTVVTNDVISAVCSSLKHLEELKVVCVDEERLNAGCLHHLHKLSRIKILRFEDTEASYTQLQALVKACKTLKYLQFPVREDDNATGLPHEIALDMMMGERSGAYVGPRYVHRDPVWEEPLIPGSAFNTSGFHYLYAWDVSSLT